MQRRTVATPASVGLIARHNVSDAHGHRLLAKGRLIQADDVVLLLAHGISHIEVVEFEPDDIDEHAAAAIVATRCSASGVTIRPPHHGRVDVFASHAGVVLVDDMQLAAWHAIPGVTVATLRHGSGVQAGQRIATIKILPFAIPRHALAQTPMPAVRLQPYGVTRLAVLIIGDPAVWERLQRTHLRALLARLRPFPVCEVAVFHLQADSAQVTLRLQQLRGYDMIVTLTETSIMDATDVTPASVLAAGGVITCAGAPVEPGNLLLLAQLGSTVILGAPGCIRSMARNVVDLVLPRLLAGVPVTAHDVYAFANGGLLSDESA